MDYGCSGFPEPVMDYLRMLRSLLSVEVNIFPTLPRPHWSVVWFRSYRPSKLTSFLALFSVGADSRWPQWPNPAIPGCGERGQVYLSFKPKKTKIGQETNFWEQFKVWGRKGPQHLLRNFFYGCPPRGHPKQWPSLKHLFPQKNNCQKISDFYLLPMKSYSCLNFQKGQKRPQHPRKVNW